MSGTGTGPGTATEAGYTVHVEKGRQGWAVDVIDPSGAVALRRPCSDELDARTFASTVRQHIYWLSPDVFEAYYRLGDEG